ncbi:MAG: hypothetical protein WC551_12525 [Patescibacteria group bacterium]
MKLLEGLELVGMLMFMSLMLGVMLIARVICWMCGFGFWFEDKGRYT